jgi:hypothetical protein
MADTATLEQDIARIKEDIAGIKAEMKHFATKADLEALKGTLNSDLEALKGDLRTEIEHMGRTLIMWNVSSMIALAGIVVAIVRFMK